MNAAEKELLERGWGALVERLGQAEATRFVMLLDRRTGSGVQHLQRLAMEARPPRRVLRPAAIGTLTGLADSHTQPRVEHP